MSILDDIKRLKTIQSNINTHNNNSNNNNTNNQQNNNNKSKSLRAISSALLLNNISTNQQNNQYNNTNKYINPTKTITITNNNNNITKSCTNQQKCNKIGKSVQFINNTTIASKNNSNNIDNSSNIDNSNDCINSNNNNNSQDNKSVTSTLSRFIHISNNNNNTNNSKNNDGNKNNNNNNKYNKQQQYQPLAQPQQQYFSNCIFCFPNKDLQLSNKRISILTKIITNRNGIILTTQQLSNRLQQQQQQFNNIVYLVFSLRIPVQGIISKLFNQNIHKYINNNINNSSNINNSKIFVIDYQYICNCEKVRTKIDVTPFIITINNNNNNNNNIKDNNNYYFKQSLQIKRIQSRIIGMNDDYSYQYGLPRKISKITKQQQQYTQNLQIQTDTETLIDHCQLIKSPLIQKNSKKNNNNNKITTIQSFQSLLNDKNIKGSYNINTQSRLSSQKILLQQQKKKNRSIIINSNNNNNSKNININMNTEKKNVTKKQPNKEKFACQKGSNKSQYYINQFICDQLMKFQNIYQNDKDVGRKIAYMKAVSAIKSYHKQIQSEKDIAELRGIGMKISKKIKQLLSTGKIQKLQRMAQEQQHIACKQLSTIWGIGPSKAKQLYSKNIKSIQQLKQHQQLLNKNQRIGLKYVQQFKQRIPRVKAKQIYQYVRETIISQMTDNKQLHEIQVCGSYRRGKQTCGDVDIIITRKDGKFETWLLLDLVQILEKKGFVTDHLSLPSRRGIEYNKPITYMGVCVLPTVDTQKQYHEQEFICEDERQQQIIHHRIDIKYYPRDQYSYALLYFTGSDMFNRSMRLFARRKGYTLSDKGMCQVQRRENASKIKIGDNIAVLKQQQIFEILGLDYKLPNQRNV